ncbi:MAG: acyl-CoA thioesterase domain-containing protein [Actinomycetota bacterium]
MTQGTERLLHRLDLQAVERHGEGVITWEGIGGENAMNMSGRLFGGFVLAQTVVAAGRTVPNRRIHSLQQVFLRGGQPTGPIHYRCTPLFAGRTYASSRIEVFQDAELISHAQVGYTAGVEGPERADVPSPRSRLEDTVNRDQLRNRRNWDDQPLEMRVVEAHERDTEPRLDTWFRPFGAVPDDQVLHQALMAFASDRGFMTTAWKPFQIDYGQPRGATLDHTIWFHRPVTLDDWHVFVMDSPAVIDGRGMSRGTIQRRDGTLVATLAQQGAFRPRRTPEEPTA